MSSSIPLATVEVRWFFEGAVDQHTPILEWFETARVDGERVEVGPLEWKERTDTYLLLPDSDDMGIKWREGQLQVKGRVSSFGTQLFCGRHQGVIERWVKWSYAELPASYHALFEPDVKPGLVTVPVRKHRALRRVRLDTLTGAVEEVGPKTTVNRGLSFEFTHLKVAGKVYSTVAFEAFPDDSAIDAAFLSTVEAYVDQLQDVQLSAASSYSYPAWLGRIV